MSHIPAERALDIIELLADGAASLPLGEIAERLGLPKSGAHRLLATLVNLGCFWFWEIPLAWALALHLKLGPHGVFLAVAISYGTLAVVSAILFRRGSWKLKYV